MKRLQNKIAESGLLLPVAALIGLLSAAASLLGAMPSYEGLASLACFALTAYMMVEMSNANALIRVRSRMVTSTFIVLSAAGGLVVGPVPPVATQLSFVAACLILFSTYQDKRSMGRTFYAFFFIGLASCTSAQTFLLVPVVWLLMATQLQSFSWRNWMASLLGLLTPYWLMLPWLILERDFTLWTNHVQRLITFHQPFDYTAVSLPQAAVFLFTLTLSIVGMVHFWHRSYEDKIRIRLLYGFFTAMTLVCAVFLIVQPQHYATLMRLLLVFASPLIAHFFTLTSSRLTNAFFVAMLIVSLALGVLTQLWPLIAR